MGRRASQKKREEKKRGGHSSLPHASPTTYSSRRYFRHLLPSFFANHKECLSVPHDMYDSSMWHGRCVVLGCYVLCGARATLSGLQGLVDGGAVVLGSATSSAGLRGRRVAPTPTPVTHAADGKGVLRLALPFGFGGPLLLHPADGRGIVLPLLLRRAHFFRKDVRFPVEAAKKTPRDFSNFTVKKTRKLSHLYFGVRCFCCVSSPET